MDNLKFTQTRAFRLLLWCIGIAAAVLVVYQAGFYAGTHRAFFNCKWGENYGRNFGGPAGFGLPRMAPAPGPMDMSGHGVTGEIIDINSDGRDLVVRGRDGAERLVTAATGTSVIGVRGDLKLSSLKVGDVINVIGRPDELGRIGARMIRVLPGGFPNPR